MQPDKTLAPSHHVNRIMDAVTEGVRAKVLMCTHDDSGFDGKYLRVDGQTLHDFGTCSYLGLERREELSAGATAALERYGTQFSFSRAYLQCPLYPELESLLDTVTGRHTLITPSTTLGHIAAIPTIVEPGDAVLVDLSAHASVHTALALLRGVDLVPVPHGRAGVLADAVRRLEATHRRVWYFLDGLYSMQGDLAPFAELKALLSRHPALHLYVDDAHSTSWSGQFGRGQALAHLADVDRMVVALSLNKAFAAAGGALVFPDTDLRDRVRRCGGPMLFSGPVQPPMLGAAVASAKLHLEPAFALLQEQLMSRIDAVLANSEDLGITMQSSARTPLFFVECGPVETTLEVVLALRKKGFFVTTGMYPAVPYKKSGVRFSVSVKNSNEDIRAFLEAVSEEASRRNVASCRGSGTFAVDRPGK